AGPHGFVFSAGGFHPNFPPDARIAGPLKRMSVAIAPAPTLSMRGEAYFAVTASTLQFGGAFFLKAELGPINAGGRLSFDALIHTEPRLSFVAEASAPVRLRIADEDVASIDLHVHLEGPGRWRARARATVHLPFLPSKSGTLDLSWGTEPGDNRGQPIDLAE